MDFMVFVWRNAFYDITKSIVEDHKGKIYAESIIGESASFIVELPINNEKLKVDSNKLT